MLVDDLMKGALIMVLSTSSIPSANAKANLAKIVLRVYNYEKILEFLERMKFPKN